MKNLNLEIDDSYSSTSKLTLEDASELESVRFIPRLQHFGDGSFYLHVSDIDKVINYLKEFKELNEIENELDL